MCVSLMGIAPRPARYYHYYRRRDDGGCMGAAPSLSHLGPASRGLKIETRYKAGGS